MGVVYQASRRLSRTVAVKVVRTTDPRMAERSAQAVCSPGSTIPTWCACTTPGPRGAPSSSRSWCRAGRSQGDQRGPLAPQVAAVGAAAAAGLAATRQAGHRPPRSETGEHPRVRPGRGPAACRVRRPRHPRWMARSSGPATRSRAGVEARRSGRRPTSTLGPCSSSASPAATPSRQRRVDGRDCTGSGRPASLGPKGSALLSAMTSRRPATAIGVAVSERLADVGADADRRSGAARARIRPCTSTTTPPRPNRRCASMVAAPCRFSAWWRPIGPSRSAPLWRLRSRGGPGRGRLGGRGPCGRPKTTAVPHLVDGPPTTPPRPAPTTTTTVRPTTTTVPPTTTTAPAKGTAGRARGPGAVEPDRQVATDRPAAPTARPQCRSDTGERRTHRAGRRVAGHRLHPGVVVPRCCCRSGAPLDAVLGGGQLLQVGEASAFSSGYASLTAKGRSDPTSAFSAAAAAPVIPWIRRWLRAR